MSKPQWEISDAIRRDGEKALKPLYQKLKIPFLAFMRKYSQDEDLRLDAFHEAMIAFYEYCLAEKYDPSKSAPKTLIYQMGRAYLINRLRVENRQIVQEDKQLDGYLQKQMHAQYGADLSEKDVPVKEAILQLGDKCRKLLQLFFYRNYSIDAIMQEMDYKNLNVVSSHKSRCIKQVKEILQEKVK